MLSVRQWLDRRASASEPLETRESGSGYTDALLSLLVANAQGNAAKADVNTSGALELAAGIIGRGFALAQVETPRQLVSDVLTPTTLAHIGRGLIRAGECVFAINVEGGDLALLPASAWDISGGVRPESWEYRLSLSAPDGTAETTLPYSGVIHIRYAYAPDRAWVGLSPLEVARQAGQLDAEINQALADESGMPRGGILPLPHQTEDDEDDDAEPKLETTLGKLRGAIMTVESMATSASGGYTEAPKDDWLVKRVGAAFTQPLVTLRRDADEQILALCGVPIEFIKGADGNALKEVNKRMVYQTLQPLGAIVAEELSAKLEAPISFNWDAMRALDKAAGARAYRSLIQGQMEPEQALRLSGL